MYYFFFFSSRRRHTRLQGDWSSDVCSSDLPLLPAERLHDAEGAQRLLDDRERGALELLDVAVLAPHAWAIEAREHEQRWGYRQRHERQLPVQPGRDHDHGAQGYARGNEGDDPLDHDLVDHRR